MSLTTTATSEVTLSIDGHTVTVPGDHTIIQALWRAGYPRVKGVGCLEGVCGSCRVMLKRSGENEVLMALACQTVVEADMIVMFLEPPPPAKHHYRLSRIPNSWEVQGRFHFIFPEATHCRHCGGCNVACPRGIKVEHGVQLAAEGNYAEASDIFTDCIMCDLCMTGCPEKIAPNYVGMFARRVTTHFHTRPPNLIKRLEQIRSGTMNVKIPDGNLQRKVPS
jgi:succinate dehydrogenase/fumarate reductase-like Fe-S protein